MPTGGLSRLRQLAGACGAEVGPEAHRLWRCDGSLARWRQLLPDAFARTACTHAADGDVFWERLLMPHPGVAFPRPAGTHEPWWTGPVGVFEGPCHGDGSAFRVACRWGAEPDGASYKEKETGGFVSLSGLLIYPLQAVPAAELTAATQFLVHSFIGARAATMPH